MRSVTVALLMSNVSLAGNPKQIYVGCKTKRRTGRMCYFKAVFLPIISDMKLGRNIRSDLPVILVAYVFLLTKSNTKSFDISLKPIFQFSK